MNFTIAMRMDLDCEFSRHDCLTNEGICVKSFSLQGPCSGNLNERPENCPIIQQGDGK